MSLDTELIAFRGREAVHPWWDTLTFMFRDAAGGRDAYKPMREHWEYEMPADIPPEDKEEALDWPVIRIGPWEFEQARLEHASRAQGWDDVDGEEIEGILEGDVWPWPVLGEWFENLPDQQVFMTPEIGHFWPVLYSGSDLRPGWTRYNLRGSDESFLYEKESA